ncbi:MAG: tyrosine-type recombinase/integrase [Gammaproteobacteria bacterium]|nr:tyrosine-type recombinase/integrase [Gammaproteobacteria bacterium]MDH3467825.1 tyrosine-type recombinase/integrase [Gammaproteobacteria bacterium]
MCLAFCQGITDFRIHGMRHTFAAWLVSDGVPLTEVRDLLGHSTVKVTERYAHLAPENLRTAVDRLVNVSQFGHIVDLERVYPRRSWRHVRRYRSPAPSRGYSVVAPWSRRCCSTVVTLNSISTDRSSIMGASRVPVPPIATAADSSAYPLRPFSTFHVFKGNGPYGLST